MLPKGGDRHRDLAGERPLKSGVLPYPRYHLPGYESFRGSLSAAASPLSLGIGAEL